MDHRTHPQRRRAAAALAVLAMAAGALAACSKDGPDGTLDDFLAGWKKGDLKTVGFVTAAGAKVADTTVLKELQSLEGDLLGKNLVLSKDGDPKTNGDYATAAVKLTWTLPGNVPWSYDSTVRLSKAKTDDWAVVWEPAVVQSQLVSGDKLKIRRVSAVRAGILDAKGSPIVTPRDVVAVGVEPQKITNLAQLQKGLTAAFAKIDVTLDMSTLADRVAKADKQAFLSLITLRQTDYDKISSSVEKLAGAVTQNGKKDLAPTRVFARALLGTADEATKDDLDARPDLLVQGDVVGHGGLQAKYDTALRGTPGMSVVISQTAPDDTVHDTAVFTSKPVDGTPIKTTLDVTTQNAADAALTAEKNPSSLVAIRISDGTVLAVANGPDGGTVDTALTGQVPPGSTFKTVSAYGLLSQKKVTPSTVAECPSQAVVGSNTFQNSGGEQLGKVQFHVDYAKSCNTAFVLLSSKLGADGLHQAATALGLGGQWDLGIDAFSGKVSPADSPAELAEASFGQGATSVSPLSMASVAAAVARGQFKQPSLILDPAPAKPAADGTQLDATAISQLQSMMREVVTSGTGTKLKTVPGKPVYGKTGTAEFSDTSKDTHSWFIGYQGDIAFAALVQNGGAGSEAAVPIVKRFLTTLNK